MNILMESTFLKESINAPYQEGSLKKGQKLAFEELLAAMVMLPSNLQTNTIPFSDESNQLEGSGIETINIGRIENETKVTNTCMEKEPAKLDSILSLGSRLKCDILPGVDREKRESLNVGRKIIDSLTQEEAQKEAGDFKLLKMPSLLQNNEFFARLEELYRGQGQKGHKLRDISKPALQVDQDVVAKSESVLVNNQNTDNNLETLEKIFPREDDMVFLSTVNDLDKEEKDLFGKTDINISREENDFPTLITKEMKSTSLIPEKPVKVKDVPELLPDMIKATVKTSIGKKGNNNILLQLEPKELGKMLVKISSREGILSMKIMAESIHARDLLKNDLPSLRQSLTAHGIAYDQLDVEVGSQTLDQGNSRHNMNWHWKQQSSFSEDSQEILFFDSISESLREGTTIYGLGKVDYFI